MIVVLYNNWTLFLITWRLKINDISLSPITDQLNENLWWVCHILGIVKKLLRWSYCKISLRITSLGSKTSPRFWQVETGREGWSRKTIQTRLRWRESRIWQEWKTCLRKLDDPCRVWEGAEKEKPKKRFISRSRIMATDWHPTELDSYF